MPAHHQKVIHQIKDNYMDKISSPKENHDFTPGMKVRILEGAFKEFRGKILENDISGQRVKVAVNFFGKEREAEFTYSQITLER